MGHAPCPKRMIVIGVTGGFGTGKSTVAQMFGQLGATVLDADVIAHELMRPRRVVWQRIVRRFGSDVLNADQTINRSRLAALVFQDDRKRRQLESLVHPPVLRRMRQDIARLRRARRVPAVVLDVPLLIEAGAHRAVDALVVVTAPRRVQQQRLRRKYGWSTRDIAARIAAQWTLSAKAALADFVVHNADGRQATRTQVIRIWQTLQVRNKPSSISAHSKN